MFYYEKTNYIGNYRPNTTNGDKPIEGKTKDGSSTIRCVKEVAVEHHMKSLEALQAIYGTLPELEPPYHYEPCPFCEGTDIQLYDVSPFAWVECNDCGARGPHTAKPRKALYSWNNR